MAYLKWSVALAIPFFFAGRGMAQENQEDTQSSESVVVKAKRFQPNYVLLKEENSTVTKTATSVLQTPQSITIITQDRINLFNSRSLNDAVRYSAGVTDNGSRDDPRGFYGTIRGFDPSIYLDGTRLPNAPSAQAYNIEPWNLEEIDILKGASSPLYGSGQLGGIINAVSKTPTEKQHNQVLFQTGSYNRVQGQADIGGSVANNAMLWRFVGLIRKSDTQAINIKNNEIFVAPSLKFHIDPKTDFTLLTQYEQVEGGSAVQFLPFWGTVTPAINGRLPRDILSGDRDYDVYSKRQAAVGYAFMRHMTPQWDIVQNVRLAHIDTVYRAVTPIIGGSTLSPESLTVKRRALLQSGNYNTFTADTHTSYRVQTGEAENLLLLGLDFRRDFSAQRRGEANAPGLNFLHPIYRPIVVYPVYGEKTNTSQSQDQAGLYFQDQFSWNGFNVLLTGREDFFTGSVYDNNKDEKTRQNDKKFTGRAGIIYNSDIGLSPYVVYATSFMPQLGVDVSGNPFVPLTGNEIEVGVKYKPENLDLLVTLAAYNLKEKNVLGPDPQNASAQIAFGAERSRGVELEVQGNLPFNTRIIASATYQEPIITRVTSASQADQLGNRETSIPNRFANLYLEKQFVLEKDFSFDCGAGVRYQGNTAADLPNKNFVNAYVVMDLTARLRYKKLSFQVNGTNMANAKYVSDCKRTTNCAYAPGRAVFATLGYEF